MVGSIQDRRRGNPAWSWTHNHKEYPTGQCSPGFLFCVCHFWPKIKYWKIPRLAAITVSPPERGLCWKNQLPDFCVLYLWSVVMKCIASTSISFTILQKLMLNSKAQFLRNSSVLYISLPLFVLQFSIWQARIAFLSANFISMSLFCIKCKTCHSWKLNWTF